jgi:hypothetical protein
VVPQHVACGTAYVILFMFPRSLIVFYHTAQMCTTTTIRLRCATNQAPQCHTWPSYLQKFGNAGERDMPVPKAGPYICMVALSP